MKVQHHLDDATLLRYASGDLDDAFSIVVATHLAMCSDCRDAARTAEEVGGRLLDEVDDVSLSEGAFERLMGKLALAERDREPEPALAAAEAYAGDVPGPLRRHIGPALDAVDWTPIAPGVRKHTIDVPGEEGSRLLMLRIEPGRAVPEHGHGGSELTLVLSGAYRDELGRFGPGDVADLDEHVEHQPRVEAGEPCICLVAMESSTRFKGVISRLLQPLVGL